MVAPITKPGFQGSHTTGAEVYIYPHGDDPVLFTSDSTIEMVGRNNNMQTQPSLVSVSTNKAMDGGPGTWSFTIKPKKAQEALKLYDSLADDDWVDIVLTDHGKKWHVMRGLVVDRSKSETVGRGGVEKVEVTISGQDHQRVWEKSPIWFNRFTLENVGNTAQTRMVNIVRHLAATPNDVVRIFLEYMLREFEGYGRASWELPKGMLGHGIDNSFLESMLIDDSQFSGVPARRAILPNLNMPDGNLWTVAKEWSDPMFCELYTDMLPHALNDPNEVPQPLSSTTRMGVIMRDKPFPILSESIPSDFGRPAGTGINSPWFNLPTAIVPKQQIVAKQTGRSGEERYNAFFVSPALAQGLGSMKNELLQPLWNPDGMKRHGLRRMDISSRYMAEASTLYNMTKTQRYILRDYMGISPYLDNGNLALGIGRPDVHIGHRIRIPGPGGENFDQTFYCESVGHEWRLGPGTKTSLGVTRGFTGTDAQLLEAIQRHADQYEEPEWRGDGA